MASSSVMETLSNELASAAERSGASVVAVHARRRMPSSGIEWRKGIVVTADHAIYREEEINVIRAGGKTVSASLVGRDPSTDLALLKTAESGSEVADFGEGAGLKLGQLVLALGRSWRGNLVASAGIIGGLSGEWRSARGGMLDQHIRLDLALYPGFSGGPLVNTQGKIIGVNTRGLTRGRAVTVPVVTVNRVVDELLEKGHIARPYLGLAMQTVTIPDSMRAKLESGANSGLLVMHVDSGSPADKAGLLLGDVLAEVQGKALEDMDTIQDLLASAKVGDSIAIRALRGGAMVQLSVKLGDRPRR
ncbi:MAG TPA: S1C family serine protease [Terriglobales bacterium]|nr:S1C family serine protease [Terriglobales bacterium]